MPSDSNSEKKRDSASSKKKKKKLEQERTTATGSSLESIPEQSFIDDSESRKEHGDDDNLPDSEGDSDDDKDYSLNDIMKHMKKMERHLTHEIARVDSRVDSLTDINRNLNASGAFDTPIKLHKKKRHKSKDDRKGSLMASVARSTLKQDWRTLAKADKSDIHDDSDDSSQGSTPKSSKSSNKKSYRDRGGGGDDSGSSDTSSSESSESDPDSDERANPRAPLGKLFRNLDLSEKIAAKTVVNVTRVEKECNVKIEKFNLSTVCRAMKKIMEFQERENTVVNMAKVLSPSVKQHLRINNSVKTGDLTEMSMSTLFSVLAKQTRVHSKVQFYSELKDALSHIQLIEWDKITPANHETYYFQQLNLVEDFNIVLKIMLQENKEFCPAVNDKENGLIRLFRSFHSYGYWKYLWSGMKQRYRRMEDFTDEYQDKALEQYQLSTALKEIPYHSYASKNSNKEDSYFKKKREISNSFNKNKSSSKFTYNSKQNILHNINASHYDSDDNSVDSVWKNSNPVVSNEHAHEDDYNSEDSLSIASNESKEVDDSEEDLHTSLLAFAKHGEAKTDKKDLPCLRKLMSGKCDLLDCPYGHRREVLLEGAQNMKGKLQAFMDTQGEPNKGSSKPPYKVLTKDKYSKE